MSGSKRVLGQALLVMMSMLTSAAERSATYYASHVDLNAKQNRSVEGDRFFGGWKETDARPLNISEARYSAVKTLVDRFDGAQETLAGRPVITRKEFTVASNDALATMPLVDPPKWFCVHANSTGYIQEITADGFVKCDFDGLGAVVSLSAEDAVDAGLEVRSKLHRAVHGDATNRPQHRAHGLDWNSLALKNAPFVKSALTEPLRIVRDVHNGKLGCCSGQSAARCVTKSIVPLAAEVTTAATLFGTGGGSMPVMVAREIAKNASIAAAIGGGLNDIAQGKLKPSYSTAQSIVGCISPGVSTCMSLGTSLDKVGSQIRQARNDPSAPGVDIMDVGRLVVDGVAVTRFAVDQLETIDESSEGFESSEGHNDSSEGLATNDDVASPTEAAVPVAGGSTPDLDIDHKINWETPFTLDDARALCRDGRADWIWRLNRYHCPQQVPRGDGKYDCVCHDYGKGASSHTVSPHTPAPTPAPTPAATPEPTTAAAETGLDAPNDVYVQKGDFGAKLPSDVSEASMLKHLNEVQHAKETSNASLWQKLFGTVLRQPAQELSSCDNVATSSNSNCGSEGRPIEYVTQLVDGRLGSGLFDFKQIDALLPRIKQFTFVMAKPNASETCEHFAKSEHGAKVSMDYMANKYPGIPIRMVCADWNGIQSGAVEL